MTNPIGPYCNNASDWLRTECVARGIAIILFCHEILPRPISDRDVWVMDFWQNLLDTQPSPK